MKILNLENLPPEFVWRDEIGLVTKSLGAAAGSERLNVNIDSVPPGALSTKYHSHSQQEEFFLVLEGEGTLRLNGEKIPVSKGDFIAKPAGKNIAHTFYNSGIEALVLLDVGMAEKEDTCYYPDEDVYLHKSNGKNRVYHEADIDADWSSDPNPSK